MSSPHPTKPNVRPYCYICGTTNNLTDDHIPPKGFFPPDQRKNLLVADCCKDCHQRLSDDDLAMRYWFSCPVNASAPGRWIFLNRAVPSVQARPQLHKQVVAHTTPISVPGLGLAMKADIPSSRVIPYFRRFTKALLYLFYPEYDYFSDTFGVAPEPFEYWKPLLPLMQHESRGIEVFEVWHSLDTDDAGVTSGTWIYRIYSATMFTCRHSKQPSFTVEYPKDYKEHHKLPKFL